MKKIISVILLITYLFNYSSAKAVDYVKDLECLSPMAGDEIRLQAIMEERNCVMPIIERTKKEMIFSLIPRIANLSKEIDLKLIAKFIQENIKISNKARANILLEKSIEENDIETTEVWLL